MQPDIEKYLPMLNDMDLTREQKIELIHDLWLIMEEDTTAIRKSEHGTAPQRHP